MIILFQNSLYALNYMLQDCRCTSTVYVRLLNFIMLSYYLRNFLYGYCFYHDLSVFLLTGSVKNISVDCQTISKIDRSFRKYVEHILNILSYHSVARECLRYCKSDEFSLWSNANLGCQNPWVVCKLPVLRHLFSVCLAGNSNLPEVDGVETACRFYASFACRLARKRLRGTFR